MTYLAASLVVLGSLLGIVLTAATLPGVWLAVIVAIGCELWQDGLLSWWTIGIAAGLALIGEIVDIGASAVGAARTGGGRSGAIGSMVGGIVGAIAGSVIIPVPILGTIVGAIAGAGLGAAAAERGIAEKTWKQSVNVGAGAAAGRAVAMAAKLGIAAAVGLMLSVAAFVP